MGLNASEILGSPELAGVKVNPRGLGQAVIARSMRSSGAGGLAAVAINAVADAAIQTKIARTAERQRAEAAQSSTPAFAKIAWLAATADEVALVELDAQTTLKFTGTVLARVPRNRIASVELTKSKPLTASPLTIAFTDGQSWVIEVPAPAKRSAKRLVEVLA